MPLTHYPQEVGTDPPQVRGPASRCCRRAARASRWPVLPEGPRGVARTGTGLSLIATRRHRVPSGAPLCRGLMQPRAPQPPFPAEGLILGGGELTCLYFQADLLFSASPLESSPGKTLELPDSHTICSPASSLEQVTTGDRHSTRLRHVRCWEALRPPLRRTAGRTGVKDAAQLSPKPRPHTIPGQSVLANSPAGGHPTSQKLRDSDSSAHWVQSSGSDNEIKTFLGSTSF